jgi:hypothetical protein
LPNNKATKLNNITCVYCGRRDVPENPLTDEHVISRNFVPRGSFATGWSLIANACERCNREKSQLEDDISAITLLPDLGGSHEDPKLQALAARKAAGSGSRYTGKAVARSYHRDTIEGTLLGGVVQIRFDIIGPPHLGPERVDQLAYFHGLAFFYLITYDEAQRAGSFFPGVFGLVDHARRSDWGNPVQRAFADLTSTWDSRIEGGGADGFFKVAMRRDPTGADVWSFALEWNKNLRCIGFFGDPTHAQAYVDALPVLDLKQVNATHRSRREVPLAEADDRLFVPVGRMQL